MGVVENILIPILQLLFYLFFFGAIGTIIYLGIFKKYKYKIKLFLKYEVFKREPKEKDVEWCLEAFEKQKHEIDLKKLLLLKRVNMDRVEELLYIYRKIIKMKGGLTDNEQYREISVKIE